MDSQNLDESQASEQELGGAKDERIAEKVKVASETRENQVAEAESAKAKESKSGKAKAKAKEKSSIAHKTFSVIGLVLCVILIPILIMNCIMIVQSFTNKDEVPGIGKYKPMIVLTDSMYPVIEAGDIIISEVAKAEDVKIGDVISFYDPAGNGTSVVTHRVVDITTKDGKIHFITKGDFNNTYDREPVPADKLIGIYKDTKEAKINEIKVGDLITFFNPIATDEETESKQEAGDSATTVNLTEAPIGTLMDKESTDTEDAETEAEDEDNQTAYVDDKEALTYEVVEIKEANGKKTFIVEKEFTYSVHEKLEVSEDQIIGVFTDSRRFSGLGNVAMFMQTTTGFIICVFVPIILIVGYDIIRRKIHDKSNKKDKDELLAELERLRAEKEQFNKGE